MSVTSPQSNVRSDGSNPDVSQQHEEFKQLPDDDLRVLLCRAQVSQWADHIVALGAVCVQDVALTSAKSLAPMPILAAERLIRFAAQHSKEEAPAKLVSKPVFHFEVWERLKQIVAYLAGTIDHGITFRAGDRDGWDRVAVFTDSDFAASYDSRRSTTGVIVAYNGSPACLYYSR